MAKHTVATLRKPATAVGPPYRFDGEANLHHAFRQLKLVAEALAATKYHHDALTNIYLSIECFLKYLYCLVREQEVPASFYLTSMTKSVGEQLGAKDRFGHDLRAMTLVLSAHTDLSNFREYLNLERSLPAGTAWVAERYAVRNHPGRKFQYDKVAGFFIDFLNGAVRHLV